MKSFLFTKLFLSSTAILSWLFFTPNTVANPSQTTSKQSTKPSIEYRCIDHNGYPTTLAYTSRGPIELIVWKNEYFSGSGYPPELRCRQVTDRFQQHSDAKNLRYISTGTMNRYNVICVSDRSGNCKPNGLLITIQHNHNPEKVMRDLFNLAARKSGGGINLSAGNNGGVITTVGNVGSLKARIDVDKFLAASPVISNLDDRSPSSQTTSPNPSVTSENENPADDNQPVIENPLESW